MKICDTFAVELPTLNSCYPNWCKPSCSQFTCIFYAHAHRGTHTAHVCMYQSMCNIMWSAVLLFLTLLTQRLLKISGRCHFNEQWLKKDYRAWLQKDSQNSFKAFWFVCMKSIDFSFMGKSALASCVKGKKHQELAKNFHRVEMSIKISNFFTSSSFSIAKVSTGNCQNN